jgi:octaprenyl-diphosphate synthase
MSASLDLIQQPIQQELEVFEKKFRFFMKSKVPLLDNIMNYIIRRKGKQVRPILVLLSAGIGGNITEQTFRGAALIELLHTASLVHDDVVDNSQYRRGFFSINALWKNKIAVLVGDFLLAKGLLLSIDNGDFQLLKIVSKAVREMSEGELLQMEKARMMDITEEVYYEIIRQKTATLIAACCGVGAASTSQDEEFIQKMTNLGEMIGIAFQIKDDLFDYGNDEIGKPVGIDIKEKKMTLPLIYALSKASWWDKRRIIYMIKNQSENPKKVAEVIDFVKSSGGLEYATKAMQDYILRGKQLLQSFPSSNYRDAFDKLIDYVIERKK